MKGDPTVVRVLEGTDKYIVAYHNVGWLPGVLVCNPTILDFPTIDIVCFESHLMCEFGLPPSKFRVSFLNYFTCELVRLHLNAIAAQTLLLFDVVNLFLHEYTHTWLQSWKLPTRHLLKRDLIGRSPIGRFRLPRSPTLL
jgi:hypothetical protein